jgi:hypothetical protein
MAKKSDKGPEKTRESRISATEANRSFSEILDQVELGRRFLVHRHGRDVCTMASPSTTARRASECLAILRGRASVLLDEGFGRDLLGIVASEPAEDRATWES